jgi:hypothetical protein
MGHHFGQDSAALQQTPATQAGDRGAVDDKLAVEEPAGPQCAFENVNHGSMTTIKACVPVRIQRADSGLF